MPVSVLSAVEYGGYISIVKLIVFLVLFYPWLALVGWVNEDSEQVDTNQMLWTGIVFGAGVAASLLWLLIPIFFVGLGVYVLFVGVTAIMYVHHRNGLVLEYDRVMSLEHIKSLLKKEKKEGGSKGGFEFVTANKNVVPAPQPKTPAFFGYRAGFDLIKDAIWRRAETVVLLPAADEYKVSYVIDGVSAKQPSMDKEKAKLFINFIKEVAALDAQERRKPQKSHFKTRQGKTEATWEIMTAGSTAGEQVKLKRQAGEQVMKLDELGLQESQYQQLSTLRSVDQGVFLIAGPAKSGVTTTFYALLRQHDAYTNSIDTLEMDPSGDLPNVNQKVFSLSDTGTTTFAKKLHALIRMAPDIMGAAGITKSEGAKVACDAGLDGKILYVTLEADSAAEAIYKWVKLVGNNDRAIDSLLGATNQRLIRMLCSECRQAYAPKQELLHKFNLPAEKAKVLYRAGKVIFDKHGKEVICENCQGTGFYGRTALFEVAMMDDSTRADLKKAQTANEVSLCLRSHKMLSLQQQGLRKAIAGEISINEMISTISSSSVKKVEPTKPASND